MHGSSRGFRSWALLAAGLWFAAAVQAKTVPSPKQFLGYELGQRFTPHAKVLAYVRAVADASDRVRFKQYGVTPEGRELVLLFVSSPENLSRLEEIRTDLLRLTDPRKLTDPAEVEAIIKRNPAVIWLSYNVHGNESCSSEAAMKVLYHLATAQDPETLNWLRSLVIVIDPMLNPDGRDRYVNWYNSVVGRRANEDGLAVEHREPWPGGRGSHFLFDLNRDWAWAVQEETRQRLREYHRWMPQVHVDFHEMGSNSTYFFFPASRPVNPLLPPEVVKWGKIFGEGNARYFDKLGIPYFTQESFDLFYPGYGDCYPTFNGAIGMTYEQGGGGYAGLRIKRDDGTELTLTDRLNDHYYSSLATIQTLAGHRAERLRDFYGFFRAALNFKGPNHPRYVFLAEPLHRGMVRDLVNLLFLHGIEVKQLTRPVRTKAVRYGEKTARERRFGKGTLVVDQKQPQGLLARVLLEPAAQKPDTLFFYDIVSWSLPYALNLKAYWSRSSAPLPLAGLTALPPLPKGTVPEAKVGYVAAWGTANAVQFLSRCLRAKIRVRAASRSFVLNGKYFGRGALVILKKDNPEIENLSQKLTDFANAAGVSVTAAQTGLTEKGPDLGSNFIRRLKRPKVLLLRDRPASFTSVGATWHVLENIYGYPLTQISLDELKSADLHGYDVLILPSTWGRGQGYAAALDSNVVKRLQSWVRRGGVLIALGGAAQFLAGRAKMVDVTLRKEEPEGKKGKKAGLSPEEIAKRKRTVLEKQLDRQKERVPGAVCRIKIDNTHPLGFGLPRRAYVLKTNPGVFELGEKGANVAIFDKPARVTGYLSAKKEKLFEDGVFLYEQRLGRGHVVLFSDEPDFRGFWRGLDLLLCNAVFFLPGN